MWCWVEVGWCFWEMYGEIIYGWWLVLCGIWMLWGWCLLWWMWGGLCMLLIICLVVMLWVRFLWKSCVRVNWWVRRNLRVLWMEMLRCCCVWSEVRIIIVVVMLFREYGLVGWIWVNGCFFVLVEFEG